MIVYLSIVFLLACLYAGLLLIFNLGYANLKPDYQKKSQEQFSIIIAARNEESHINQLIKALINQNYPKECYEIILVNDNSTDKTLEIMHAYSEQANLKIFSVNDFDDEQLIGKKRALNIGIKHSSFEFLVFTDADCLPPANWLREINFHINDTTDFLTGYSPLVFKQDNLFSRLKNLERSSIFAVTASSFGLGIAITCTARNMVYRKSNWQKVAGYSKIGQISSGDDDLMLLLQRKLIRKYNFMFSPDSIVPAIEDKDLLAQMHQETRRGSKFKHYPLYLKLICLMVFLFYLAFISSCFLLFIDLFYLKIIVLFLLMKIIPEFIIISRFLHKIKKIKLLGVFIIAEIIYIPYFVFFALKGSFGAYKWKN